MNDSQRDEISGYKLGRKGDGELVYSKIHGYVTRGLRAFGDTQPLRVLCRLRCATPPHTHAHPWSWDALRRARACVGGMAMGRGR